MNIQKELRELAKNLDKSSFSSISTGVGLGALKEKKINKKPKLSQNQLALEQRIYTQREIEKTNLPSQYLNTQSLNNQKLDSVANPKSQIGLGVGGLIRFAAALLNHAIMAVFMVAILFTSVLFLQYFQVSQLENSVSWWELPLFKWLQTLEVKSIFSVFVIMLLFYVLVWYILIRKNKKTS